MKASEIGWKNGPQPTNSSFERLDEGHYRWCVIPPGVQFEIDHIHQSRGETSGELTVTCEIAGSDRTDDGDLLRAHFNVSSLATRKAWVKELAARANTNGEVNWANLLDNFCNRVIAAQKDGEPVVALTGVARREHTATFYTINNLTLHQRLPSSIFGWGGVGKSYVALYCAGTLATQGVRVLYIDGELDAYEHDERCGQLFGLNGMKNLYYLRLRSLPIQRDYVKRQILDLHIEYLVLDSITKLAGGKLEESDTAKAYIDALDSLKLGSLNIAHITKSAQSSEIRPQDQKIFGAAQWDQLLRHSWFVKGDGNHPGDAGGAVLGFYLTKSNTARIGQSVGWRFTMGVQGARFEPCELVQTELAKHEPLKARLTSYLSEVRRLITYEEAGEELGVKAETIRKAVSRNLKLYRRIDTPDGKTTFGLRV